jgi:histidine phosphotransferase ChpT
MQAGLDRSDRSLALRLTELLATRLCHDLSGPLGGLAAALGEVGADEEALPLAKEAAAALRRRLALLRAAWGAPTALDAAALRDLTEGLPNARRIEIAMQGPIAEATLAPVAARLLLNVLILAAESLPAGGVMALEGDPGSGSGIVLRLAGPRAGWPEGFGAMLADPPTAWAAIAAAGEARPARLQAVLTALMIHDAGARARLLLGPSAEPAPLLLQLGA